MANLYRVKAQIALWKLRPMRAEKTVDGSGADLPQQILSLMTERWFATLLQHIHGFGNFLNEALRSLDKSCEF